MVGGEEQDEDVKDVKDEKDDEEEEAAARVEALRAAFSPTASSRQHHCEARSDMYLVCTTNDVGVKFVSCQCAARDGRHRHAQTCTYM